jgi:excisionase family DNA binding protein
MTTSRLRIARRGIDGQHVDMNTRVSLVTLDELSRRLRLSRRWLRREVSSGRLPFLQAGQRRLFNPDAVCRVLAERASVKVVAHE